MKTTMPIASILHGFQRKALAAASAALALLLHAPLRAEDAPRVDETFAPSINRAVLELFTSQGCSDCPAADALLSAYAKQQNLLVLTYPVDYWDYLGWKDTLASPRNAERQRAYAKNFDTGPVSTPEVVVNGTARALGSSINEIESALAASDTALSSRRVPIRMQNSGGMIVIDVPGVAHPDDQTEATIWLAVVQRRAEAVVKSGENAGKTLTYYNVVRELTPAGVWTGRPVTVRLSTGAIMHPETEDLIALLQENETGPIIGAGHLMP